MKIATSCHYIQRIYFFQQTLCMVNLETVLIFLN